MKHLMKYEFRKTLIAKLIILGTTAVLEILFLIGLYTKHDSLAGYSTIMLTMLAFGGVLFIGLQSVMTLHRDMNTKQSYMLFMTPNSSYKILGAKVLENGLSILMAGAFFFALGMLDISLALAKFGRLDELRKFFQDLVSAFNENILLDAPSLASLTFSLLAAWIATVTAAFLADVISAALLNGKRFNGVVTFLLFLVFNFCCAWVQNKATASIASYQTTFLVQGAIALAFSVLMYFVTARIMEDKLSV